MKKKYLVLICCSLLSLIAIGQNKKIDSLQSVLKTQKEDNNKVNTLNALSFAFGEVRNIQETQKNAEEAFQLAEKLNYKKGIADSYINFSFVAAGTGDNNERLKNNLTALKLYKEINDKQGIFTSSEGLAIVYSRQGNYPEALKNAFAALKIAEEEKDKQKCISANNLVAGFFDDQFRFSEAIKYKLSNLTIYKETGNKLSGTIICISLGNTYLKQNKYAEAMKYFSQGLQIANEFGNKSLIANVYSALGQFYSKQLNYSESIKNYQLAFDMRQQTGNKNAISSSYNEMGNIYNELAQTLKNKDSIMYRQESFSKALTNYLAAIKIDEETGSKRSVSYEYQLVGDCYSNQLNFTEAVKNYLIALKTGKESGRKISVFDAQLRLGYSYTELKQFSEARQYLNEALSLAKEIGHKVGIKSCYEFLAYLDEVMGNWQEANENYKKFIVYRDSLDNKENSEKIVRMQMQYDFDKKSDSLNYNQALTDERLKQQTLLSQRQQQSLLLNEKEFALLNNEKQMQQLKIQKDSIESAGHKAEADKKQGQLVLLNKEKAIQMLELNRQKQQKKYLLAGLALFLVLAFFVYRSYRNSQQLKLQLLRNKIATDLHDDIGSTLSSISIFSQMAQQQSKEVIPMLETIGENSRKMLDAMADIVWTINPENDQFEKIILRMRNFAYELLGAKKIDFEFLADEDVANMKLSMDVRKNLYLIFKEATNNMVKYSDANKALFSIKGEKNNLTMLIRDNGKGFDTGRSTNGNGLKNMKKRAEEMGAYFTIDSKPGAGTTIELKIAV